jgi:hypothetical protein
MAAPLSAPLAGWFDLNRSVVCKSGVEFEPGVC